MATCLLLSLLPSLAVICGDAFVTDKLIAHVNGEIDLISHHGFTRCPLHRTLPTLLLRVCLNLVVAFLVLDNLVSNPMFREVLVKKKLGQVDLSVERFKLLSF